MGFRDYRIGHGSDFHELEAGRHSELWLGGVAVPSSYKVKAYSDGDCLLHALVDATLGAFAMGDIGQWFPDTDLQNKDRSSRDFVALVYQKVRQMGWELVNLDTTVFLESPRLSPYTLRIRQSLASLYKVELERVSVKAKSFEGLLLDWGGGLIICQASVLFGKKE